MNKILKEMAKRNMAKAAAMMMLMFGSMQQSSAGIGENLTDFVNKGTEMMKPVGESLRGMKDSGIEMGKKAFGATADWYVNGMSNSINKVSTAIVKHQSAINQLYSENFAGMSKTEALKHGAEIIKGGIVNGVKGAYEMDIQGKAATEAIKNVTTRLAGYGTNLAKGGLNVVKSGILMAKDNPAMALTVGAVLVTAYVGYKVISNWWWGDNKTETEDKAKVVTKKKVNQNPGKSRFPRREELNDHGMKQISKNKTLVSDEVRNAPPKPEQTGHIYPGDFRRYQKGIEEQQNNAQMKQKQARERGEALARKRAQKQTLTQYTDADTDTNTKRQKKHKNKHNNKKTQSDRYQNHLQ